MERLNCKVEPSNMVSATCWQHRVLQPSQVSERGVFIIRKNPSRGEIPVAEVKIERLHGLTVDKQCHSQEGATGVPSSYN